MQNFKSFCLYGRGDDGGGNSRGASDACGQLQAGNDVGIRKRKAVRYPERPYQVDTGRRTEIRETGNPAGSEV